MKLLIALISAGVLCVGCSNSEKEEALSQKLDTVISNQTAINAKLDALPKMVSDIGLYYYTNECVLIYSCHTNAAQALVFQADSIESAVNSETRRVGVVILTNVADFQADTLVTLDGIKLSR